MSGRRIDGLVAIVTGASRGIGRGIALQLAEAGATVYITGRTLTGEGAKYEGSLQKTAEEISARGGKCIAVQCDHSDDVAVDGLFERVSKEQDGRLDIMVNNAYAGVDVISKNLHVPYWEQDMKNWDVINNVGLRNHFRCTVHASRLMVPHKQGLIVYISSVGGLRYLFNVPYGVGKAALDRVAQDCAFEVRKHNVTVISLWPGAVQTEHMVAAANTQGNMNNTEFAQLKQMIENGETVEFTGKAIVELAADKNSFTKTGRVHIVADLAAEYGFSDINGHQPSSMRSLKTLFTYTGHPWIAAIFPAFVKLPKWMFALAGNPF